MKKINNILLVDDSNATNFFNKTIIEKSGYAEKVTIVKNGKEALAYITTNGSPELIFLDINMPVMTGWEFLEEYQKLELQYKQSVIILMLGATLSKEDKEKAESILFVKGFEEKMLTKECLYQIIASNFGNSDSGISSEDTKFAI
ncbi:response regulator [Aquimarina algicola]|uniref:Response regulator n=1 Tax=Aquimarina algicola TaxID=2589995 RepID=A0A504IUW2_9FLAO|nr:response regulator [Aquimarina algicola]TPN82267.1 response regulator [Aquimarina algicola]